MSMRSLQDKDRKKMLHQLGKAGALQGNAKGQAAAIGYRGGRAAVAPNAKRPNMGNSPDTFAKWAQAALSMVLGTKVKIDGNIGPVTRNLIKQFQRLEGLTAHGYLDERTIQVIELRTGVKSPRGFAHEPVPHLLVQPRRGIWKPKPDNKKDKSKKRQQQAGEPTADQAKDDPAHAAAEAAAEKSASQPAKPGLLQDEAMGAVGAQAFDNDFAHLAADRLGREDWEGVQNEMHGWWSTLQEVPAAEQPRWLHLAAAEARARDQQAAGRVRRRWWSQHVDGDLT